MHTQDITTLQQSFISYLIPYMLFLLPLLQKHGLYAVVHRLMEMGFQNGDQTQTQKYL